MQFDEVLGNLISQTDGSWALINDWQLSLEEFRIIQILLSAEKLDSFVAEKKNKVMTREKI